MRTESTLGTAVEWIEEFGGGEAGSSPNLRVAVLAASFSGDDFMNGTNIIEAGIVVLMSFLFFKTLVRVGR